ncbi:nitric oxide reductase activation protein NorD [Planococcus lenghuensis]|uniref:VWA domain-containing protein n=1 Tax=Planococcus lenghuensis TaxID=2213202 RepID=A0A1Q2KZF1_9BACL|nr:VWA domain-containing protein [Planococcus lenghuensis]AQQ53504.1 VWA domain-containing protein [Planococcus lenghuensis]
MASVNRFIQFNNETVDAALLNRLETLARALADAPYLQLTMRKLLELRPTESAVSISVFWKHRNPETVRNGYLSDVYLLAAGYWRHFSLDAWQTFSAKRSPLPELRTQLLLCAEEFRLSEKIRKQRPGTNSMFDLRESVYAEFHSQQYAINRQKGFHADALLNAAYLALRDGRPDGNTLDDMLFNQWTGMYDAASTRDAGRIVDAMMDRIEFLFQSDMIHTYYTFGDPPEKLPKPREHKGAETENEVEEKLETVEEWFQAWHREMESESDQALEFELERGDSAEATGGREEEGGAEVHSTARGESEGEHKESGEATDRKTGTQEKKAGKSFGREHENVVYEEQRIQADSATRPAAEQVRLRQEPHVRALLKELRKRMQQKEQSARVNLMSGRLSKKLTGIATEDRPKPFYRKSAPSGKLDAVFGLLVDGSASMIDKLEETKQAVLLFHDVLRKLDIPHEIVLFYEDAFEADEDRQPNRFEWIHRFEDGVADHATSIFSLDAHEDNRDGFAIRWMMGRMQKRQEKHKFLLVFSDGEPSAYNYAQNGIVDTASAVTDANKAGIEVLHLFLNTENVTEEQAELFRTMYGNRSVSAGSLEQFTEQTLRLLKRTLHLVVQSG